jgi:hypothetical protein
MTVENPRRFIKGKYWSSQEFREATDKTAKRSQMRENKNIPNEPEARIENYFKRFTDIFEREKESERIRGVESIKRLLQQKYIVKPENISDDYIKGVLFGNFAEQKGYTRGDIKDSEIRQNILKQFQSETGQDFNLYKIPEDERKKVREMAVKDQKARLESWFNYLTSPEAENIPLAYRYWAFAEMLKMGSYDEDRKKYNKRNETTAAPFPELDQQALALVFDEIRRKQIGKTSQIDTDDKKSQEEFSNRLKSENFNKLYAFAQEHLNSLRLPTERLSVTEGEWRVFPQGSNAREVVNSLEGFHTKWCIAGQGTAEGYLSRSDLHIYFSQNTESKNTIPRACIVDSKDRGITEVRGVISDEVNMQHLDDYIAPVVEEKLENISGGEKWRDSMKDMKRLAGIHLKHQQREELTRDDLRFIYEIDGKINTTGYGQDPRIQEILQGRDVKEDLSSILNIPREQISTNEKEALTGGIKYHYGNLDFSSFPSAKMLELPESINGNLYLNKFTPDYQIKLPKSVSGRTSWR